MDSLLINDHYKDYSELIAVAVENLWILGGEVNDQGFLVIGADAPQLSSSPESSSVDRARPAGSGKPENTPPHQSKATGIASTTIKPEPVCIPDLFLAEGLSGLSPETVELSPIESSEQNFTLDRWLFGQYNKLLPVKANCRALTRLAAGKENGLPVDATAVQIAEAAAILGNYLADHDRRHKIGRDDSLATAFPRSGPDAEKSRVRYANQFVGSINSHNVLSGLLWDYRLAGLASLNSPLLLPTKQAVHLAKLTNPILDGCQSELGQKFSAEETDFLLKHIRSHVPVEAFAFRTLIQAITDGADTPRKLDEALSGLVPIDSNRSLSPSFLTSQRSGALSRMADLGLIARVRKGVKVSYMITPDGKAFVANISNKTEREKS